MNAKLLNEWFDELTPVGADPEGGVTRLAYSAEEDGMFEKVAGFAARLGFATEEDCVGNMYIFSEEEKDMPCHTIGSHLDSVPRGGMYDGVIGVLAGLLVMEKVRRLDLSIPVKCVVFRCEESSLYGLATAGSGAVTGSFDVPHLKRAKSLSGESLYEAMAKKGYSPGTCGLKPMLDFTELHIEQGRVLWESGEKIGVVTAIAAPTRLKATFHGRQDHSGATPMDLRRDALCAAAEVILAVEKAGRDEKELATVGTTGVVHVVPGALNVIPGTVELRIDIRGIDKDSISRAVEAVRQAIQAAEGVRGIPCDVEVISASDPVVLDEAVIESLSAAAGKAGLSWRRMASGAGHDAMKVASLVPAGMIFIPCREGISHSPAEDASLEDVALGAEIILEGIKIRRESLPK